MIGREELYGVRCDRVCMRCYMVSGVAGECV